MLRRPTTAAAAGDPIPFEHDGTMHLFYLSSPVGTQDYPERVRTTWQHAASDDLVTWRELPPAIEPGPEGAFDTGGIWTGSVVEHDGVFHLFYTAHDPASDRPQQIARATSTDLLTFERDPGNPVLLPTGPFETVDWRDPYVFYNEAEGCWWMLIAARRDSGPRWTRGCIVLATSPDLESWVVEETPLHDPDDTYCPECPELWELEDRWVLVYSRFSEEVGTTYRVADSPRGPFRIPEHDALGGRRWYAAKSAPWGDDRAFFGWVHDVTEQPDGTRRWAWGGDFALPRLVSFTDDRLAVRPVDACFAALHDAEPVEHQLAAVGGRATSDVTEEVPARLLIELRIDATDAASVGLDLVDPTDESSTRTVLDLRRGRLEVSGEPRPLDDFWADLTARGGQHREVDGPVLATVDLPGDVAGRDHHLRVVLDGTILEVYLDDDVALTHRIRRADAEQLVIFAVDGDAVVSTRTAPWEDRGAHPSGTADRSAASHGA